MNDNAQMNIDEMNTGEILTKILDIGWHCIDRKIPFPDPRIRVNSWHFDHFKESPTIDE